MSKFYNRTNEICLVNIIASRQGSHHSMDGLQVSCVIEWLSTETEVLEPT